VLPVEGAVATSPAECVRFGVSFTERRRSFCLQIDKLAIVQKAHRKKGEYKVGYNHSVEWDV
jgi:hypothetical protein